MLGIISLITIINIGLHLLIMLNIIPPSDNKYRFILITDVIICLTCLGCCPLSAIIWIIVSIIDWKNYGYVFKNFL